MNRILTRAIGIVALLLAFAVAGTAALFVVTLNTNKADVAQQHKEVAQRPAQPTAAIDHNSTPVAAQEERRAVDPVSQGAQAQPSPAQTGAVTFTEFSDAPMFGVMQEGSAAADMFPLLKNTIAQSLKEPAPVFQDLFAVGDRKVSGNQYAAVFCGHVNAKNSGKQTFVVIPAANLIALGAKANEPYDRLCAGNHPDPG
jgi:hypothetical protein